MFAYSGLYVFSMFRCIKEADLKTDGVVINEIFSSFGT